AVLAAVLLTAFLRAAAPPTPESPAAAVRLVRQLGAGSFADREDAARRLLRLGPPAAPSLRNGLQSPDPERRRQWAALLPAVLPPDGARRLDAFLRNGSLKGAPPLPGWTVVKKLAGDDLVARLLYADLYRADRALLALLDTGPGPTPAHV